MLCENHLTVRKVEDEDLSLEGFAHDLCSVFKGKVLDDTHGDAMRVLGVELDAGHGTVLRVRGLVKKLAGDRVHGVDFRAGTSFLITELLKVILENIDNFVGLQLALHSGRHLVNEGVQALSQLGVVLQRLGSLSNEVLRVVVGNSIDRAVVVGLRLEVDHLPGRLETNLQLFAVESVHLPALFLNILQIVSALTRLFVNELTVTVVAEILSLHGHISADQRSN